MSVLFVVVPVVLVILVVAVGGYVWAARRGQFDDLVTPAMRVLHEDADEAAPSPEQPPSR